MDLYVLDKSFRAVGIVDTYSSLIWTDRYDDCGDFEFFTTATKDMFNLLSEGYYLYTPKSDYLMIIEGHETTTDVETGVQLITTGRSLESILDRRIVWGEKKFEDVPIQTAVQQLINEAIVKPSDGLRKISNFVFEYNSDSRLSNIKVSYEFKGENLLEAISQMCKDNDVGFRIRLSSSNQFVFRLFIGDDRSYNQTKNLYILFSPFYDNIVESSYLQSENTYKTVTLVYGATVYPQDSEYTYKTTVFRSNATKNLSGIDRREIFTDAANEEAPELVGEADNQRLNPNDAWYYEKLKTRGRLNLKDNGITKTFTGKVDSSNIFVYDKDFFMGDIVQCENDLGQTGRARVTEFIHKYDRNGYEQYPTFKFIDSEVEKTD